MIGDEEEQRKESRRAGLRKGQRDRRKVMIREIKTKITTIKTKHEPITNAEVTPNGDG